jgi:hypothetical protein
MFKVIENTPGEPVELDPVEFETSEEAEDYALRLYEHLHDLGYDFMWGMATSVYRSATWTHPNFPLRVIEILEVS